MLLRAITLIEIYVSKVYHTYVKKVHFFYVIFVLLEDQGLPEEVLRKTKSVSFPKEVGCGMLPAVTVEMFIPNPGIR